MRSIEEALGNGCPGALFGQDQLAKAGGLQAVRLTLMTDVEHTLFAKQLLAVQRPNAISSAR